MMSEQTTEQTNPVTLIHPKAPKPPSLWMNLLTLILLFSFIVGAKEFTGRWFKKEPIPEHPENSIVMEDLDNDKPIAESPAVVMAPEETKAVQEEKPTPPPQKKRVSKKNKQKNKARIAAAAKSKKSPYSEPDVYTDGGALDLDRKENRQLSGGTVIKSVMKSAPAQATATKPLPLSDRDRMIPFE